jgi:hypothetical protein
MALKLYVLPGPVGPVLAGDLALPAVEPRKTHPWGNRRHGAAKPSRPLEAVWPWSVAILGVPNTEPV